MTRLTIGIDGFNLAMPRGTGVAGVVIDCETGQFRLGLARGLADGLGAEHLPVGHVDATQLAEAVHGRVA